MTQLLSENQTNQLQKSIQSFIMWLPSNWHGLNKIAQQKKTWTPSTWCWDKHHVRFTCNLTEKYTSCISSNLTTKIKRNGAQFDLTIKRPLQNATIKSGELKNNNKP